MTSLIQSSATDVVPPGGPADERKDKTARNIRDKYDEGVRAIRTEQLNYEINSSFIQGNQWLSVNYARQQIVELPRNPARARVTVPRLRPESRRIISKVMQRPLSFEVPADASDDAHVRGARIAEGVLVDASRRLDWERHRETLAWVVWKGGTGALCLDWDGSAGQTLELDPVTSKKVGTGDIKTTTLSITEMVTEAGVRDITRGAWWIKAQAIPCAEAQRLYKLAEKPASDAATLVSPLQSKVINTNAGATNPPGDLCLVLTYYERPNSENEKGTIAVCVGNTIVDGPHPWYFPFTDRLNLSVGRETLIETRWTGDTILSDAVPVQVALNSAWSSMTEHMKLAGNARLFMEEASADLLDNYTDEAGEFQLYRDKPPVWGAPPQMPDWWVKQVEQLAAQMDDILGVHDVSRGEAPRNVQSGLGIQILVEQDETPTGHLTRMVSDVFGDYASMVLQLFEAKVPEDESRTATMPRQGYRQGMESMEWNGKSFMGQTYACVPYEDIAPVNETARFQRAILMKQANVIQTDQQFADYVDSGGDHSIMEEINYHVAKANRENHALAMGEPMVPADFDDHGVHINCHNKFRSTAEYERADPQVKAFVDMHVQAHSTFAAEQAGAQALKMQYAPELAAAAQAGMPPGSAIPAPPGSGLSPEGGAPPAPDQGPGAGANGAQGQPAPEPAVPGPMM